MSTEAEGTIRLLICDDQAIVCEGLRAMLEPIRHSQVVGVATNGVEALELTRITQPDLVLMDLKMPRMNGIAATRAIREQFSDVHILVLTTYAEDEWVIDAIRAGAAGYVLKDTPQEDLLKAIRETMQGWSHIDPQVAAKIRYCLSRGNFASARSCYDVPVSQQLSSLDASPAVPPFGTHTAPPARRTLLRGFFRLGVERQRRAALPLNAQLACHPLQLMLPL